MWGRRILILSLYHLSEWTTVDEYEVAIGFDLESRPLQIVTDSVLGSDELLRVEFQPEEGLMGHGLQVEFTNPPQYKIGPCTTGWVTFSLSDTQTRTWTITKTNNEAVSLSCNGVEIFNYLFSASSKDNCVERWTTDVVKMKFKSGSSGTDTASDEYREKSTGRWEALYDIFNNGLIGINSEYTVKLLMCCYCGCHCWKFLFKISSNYTLKVWKHITFQSPKTQ